MVAGFWRAVSTLLASQPAFAQPVVDRALAPPRSPFRELVRSSRSISTSASAILAAFRSTAAPLRVMVNPIDRGQASDLALLISRREAVTVSDGTLADQGYGFRDPGSERAGAGSTSIVRWTTRLRPDQTTAALWLRLPEPSPRRRVADLSRARRTPPAHATHVLEAASQFSRGASVGTVSDTDLRRLRLRSTRRAALKAQQPGQRDQLFAKALNYPENQYRADAQGFSASHSKGPGSLRRRAPL